MPHNVSAESAPTKIIEDAADSAVLFKLTGFSLALAVIPLSSYFLSMNYLWGGNSTYAALTAIVSANAVLIAYILLSISDDRASRPGPPKESKKDI
ncbi:Vacuolar ATPase assembly integral membrane protein VMA21 OS=Phaeosphaeria nodorum (strain SN15 / ATCC MYA-4574 / FGSC 10173) GN=VMA21 PE=3 SV=1 [Rhizoctonia solani AG-1 IB]|uniref:Vacuolar ATPase assembly integral membrane protein VMA21 n=1 Tax=Thanatephorus cucumeris (strain AG1-IB / isolate 7/3/14) TaxID=1108050 RepID=A0A0B7FPM5_THACB|nr:Vacuolar ATPase assembly integral membrane protein VMA21 OS=Phaeosphaeria nodorum (strain SN15 / ATCC MYA-4574 / FGSC 10173) GN=VMA21 PE=3 SV=1 [Rhizoctonia solani AG-1 IB]